MNTNSVTFFQNEPIVQIPENNELILAAWQLLNPANIGQIIRLGHNVGAKKVLFINNESFKKSKIKNIQKLKPVSLSGKKVLIADDSKSNLEILTHILKLDEEIPLKVVDVRNRKPIFEITYT